MTINIGLCVVTSVFVLFVFFVLFGITSVWDLNVNDRIMNR